MKGRMVVTRAAATVVALVAGYVSYLHIVDVALRVGERPEVAYALPVTVDALMVMSTLALLGDRSNRWAQAGFLFGVAVSVTCNVASADPTWPARGVAAIPAVTLLLAVEVLVRSGHRQPAQTAGERRTATRVDSSNGHGRNGARSDNQAGGRARRGEAAKRVVEAIASAPDASVSELARLANVSRATVRRVNGTKVDTTAGR